MTTTTTTTGIAEVKQVNQPRERSDYRKSPDRFICYTDGVGRDIASEHYFSKHGIGALQFRCKSWLRVGGIAARIEAGYAKQAIEAHFPGIKVSLKFSQKAGCACGCSPGFVGTIEDGFGSVGIKGERLSRSNVWVTEVLSVEDEAEILAACVKYAKRLPAEIEKGNAELAAEKAAREETKRLEEVVRQERIARYAAQDARWAQQKVDASLDSAAL